MVTPRRSFKTLFCSQDGGALLKSAAISGSLHTSGIRAVAWAWFLSASERGDREDAIGTDKNDKNSELSSLLELVKANRANYKDLVQFHISDPRNSQVEDPTINNPLSQSEDSPWAKFFQNAELEKVIQQDIERCYPDKEFFQDPEIQAALTRILFIYAKINHALSYRQGMHELLAPIVYLLHQERFKEPKDKDPEDSLYTLTASEEQILTALLDKESLEADAFFIFKHLMDITGDWFAPVPPPKKNATPGSPPDEEAATPVVSKCRRIQHLLLKNKDPELHDHLIALKIEPQFYLLRWVRLLLGREFHSLDDLMIIWDAVFAHSPDLVLVDYICVAMLVYIREQLLERDSTGCLTRLMKYPPVEDVRIFIEQAQTLISNRLQKPPTSHPVTPPPTQSNSPGSHHIERQVSVTSSSPSTTSSKPKSKQPSKPKDSQAKVLQNLNPAVTSFKHNINVDTTSTDVATLQVQLRTLRDTQLLVAQRIDGIVQSIQHTLTTNAVQGDVDALFLSLAELKQTKDILCGFLPAVESEGEPSVEESDDSSDLDDHPLSQRQVS